MISVRRATRIWVAVGAAALISIGLTSCASGSPSTLKLPRAQADAASWAHQAATAAQSTHVHTQSRGSITCPTDHSYFQTKVAWRTVTELKVDGSPVAKAARIRATFVAQKWVADSTNAGTIVTLRRPAGTSDRGSVRVDLGTDAVTVTATTACYG